MRLASYTTIIIISLWLILTLIQVWGEFFTFRTYWKITISLALINLTILIIALIRREYLSDKHLKKNKFID